LRSEEIIWKERREGGKRVVGEGTDNIFRDFFSIDGVAV